MRNDTLKLVAGALALAGFTGLASLSAKADTPPNYNIQYGGLFDGYYQWQTNNPSAGLISGKTYDFRQNTPTLDLAELNVWKVSKPGDLGFKVTLMSGDVANVNGGGGMEARYQSVMQAYGTWFLPKGAGVDFGKFYTPVGYEITEPNGDFNETRSIPYFLGPVYHTGIRYYTPSYNGLVATVYVVQAIFNTATAGVNNDSKQASFLVNLTYNDPKGKWTGLETYGYGKNKFNLFSNNVTGDLVGEHGPNNTVNLSDTDLTYNLSDAYVLGAEYLYENTNPESNGVGVVNATDTSWAAYVKDNLTKKSDVALRYSGANLTANGVPSVNPWEATATYEYRPTSNFTERLEYQHEGSNVNSFLDSGNNITKKDQDTLEVAGIFTF